MVFMPSLDVSINMISLFAFILVLGIVVDDAIIVGESIYEHRSRGKSYLKAAVDGAVEVAGPVVFAIISTVTAFMPLLFISGTMGKFIRVIPLIVIPVLVVSLIECLYVLPAHLSLGRPREEKDSAFRRMRVAFTEKVRSFIKGPYTSLLTTCLRNRAATIAVAIAVLLISIGMVIGGIIKFQFMPNVEGDVIFTHLQMPVGTPAKETREVVDYVVEKGMLAADGFETGEEKVFRNVFAASGVRFGARHIGSSTSSSHLATIVMYLTPSETRDTVASEITARWRALVGDIPGVEALAIKSNLMDFGANINVRLAHSNFDTLQAATRKLKEDIAEYPGVINIEDSYSQGKRELSLTLKPEARTLGLTEAELASQVRAAFHGAEALRVQRGRNEVKVMVRYPRSDREALSSLENMYIRTASGQGVPFGVAAEVSENKGYSVIIRKDRKRVVNVTADVNPLEGNSEEVNASIKDEVLSGLLRDFPGLSIDTEGEQKERRESMRSMRKGFAMAMFVIFAMLAIPFRSYSQPLIIMAAIPFGIVGGIWGHLLMRYDLSILSMFGIVALSGVVVNDSLLLIDHINRMRHHGMELFDAVVSSGQRRFRPILLTSLTTFFGLAPMILETSMQAKFLIPMAISLAFGILFATGITLLLIPTLYTVLESLKLRMGIQRQGVVGLMEE
jgi:multidrug efflux pump subunit AcrB